MKKRILFFISFALAMAILASCSNPPVTPTAQAPEPTEKATPETTEPTTPEPTGELLSVDEAQALLLDWCEWNEISYFPDMNKQEEGVQLYGFMVDYSGWGYVWPGVNYCYAWVSSSTGGVRFEEAGYSEATGLNLYGNIPDNMFPIPMRDGVVIPYDWFFPPEYVSGVGYIFKDKSVMEAYQAQLKDAGFLDCGTVQSVESLWQYEQSDGGAIFTVEMYSDGGMFSMNMYAYYPSNPATPEPTVSSPADFMVTLVDRGCEITNNSTGQKAEFILGMSRTISKDSIHELALVYNGEVEGDYLEIGVVFGYERSDDPNNLDTYYIHSIKFFGTEPLTSQGFGVGDPVGKMLEIYGDDYELDKYYDTIYRYHVDDMIYIFNYNHGFEKKDSLRCWSMVVHT